MDALIRIGAYDSIAIYFLPYLIKHLQKLYPSLQIELETGRSSYIQEAIESGRLDFAFTIDPKKSSHAAPRPKLEETKHSVTLSYSSYRKKSHVIATLVEDISAYAKGFFN